MPLYKQDSNLIISSMPSNDIYCAYELHATLVEGAPPECIYVNACKLLDVFKLQQPRNNSEFVRMFGDREGMVMLRIIATGDDKREVIEFALRHQKSLPVQPRCNVVGHLMTQGMRALICSNGKEYPTQVAAALDLGVHQSIISRHLRGLAGTVKGQTLIWKA